MNLRLYRPEDLPRIMDIGNRAWEPIRAVTRNALGEPLYGRLHPNPDEEKGLQIKAHAEKHPEWVRVCEHHGQIVGFITFSIDQQKGIGEILNNAADPSLELKGIGQTMYAFVLDHFRDQGLHSAKVQTGLDPAHAPARRAYERAGFAHQLEHTSYYMTL